MMKRRIFATAGAALLLTASAGALAGVRFNVNVNPFAWGGPPPVVYAPPAYYAPPPVVYYGGGQWGGHGDGRGRRDDRGHDRGGHRHH